MPLVRAGKAYVKDVGAEQVPRAERRVVRSVQRGVCVPAARSVR